MSKFDRPLVLAALLACGFSFGLQATRAAGWPEEGIDAGLLAVDTTELPETYGVIPATHLSDAVADPRPSDAQRIARLQRTLDSDQKHLAELRAELANLEKEYQQADTDFKQLDSQLEAANRKSDSPPADLSAKWDLAKQRFELAIREHKALESSITTLETKMARDRDLLEKLLKPAAADPTTSTEEDTADSADGQANDAAASLPPAVETSTNVSGLVVSGMVGSMMPLPPGAVPALTTDNTLGSLPPVLPSEAKSKELSAAAKESKQKNVVAHQAQIELQSATERAQILDRNIALERTLLETAQTKVTNIEATVANLEAEFNSQLSAGTDPTNLASLRGQLADAKGRLRQAQAEVGQHTGQLDELHSQLAGVHAEQIAALEEAERRRIEALDAKQRWEALQNPLAWQNVWRWSREHAQRILSILLSLSAVIWLFRRIERRLTEMLARRTSRGTAEDRENRSRTLIGVIHNAAGVLVFCSGAIMLLSEFGIPTAHLMSWLAVVGLALAFGAQSLIKDFFSGFMILLEQQYMVNDVVKIDDVTGQVERITLRMTVLRDLEGHVHFIPHGEVNRVSNSTHGWSRAVFDVGVAYGEDIDRVMSVLVDLARQMREEPEYSGLILEDMEMLGVDSLGESAVVIKFFIKTRPLKQWLVRRELLRRIKNKFDQLGIEIPFPTRTLVHRHPSEAVLSWPAKVDSDEEAAPTPKHRAA
jgi:moderate conductance mechanosensitive channel